MADPLDEVLRLVAEGRLTAEEAAPVLDALQASREPGSEEESSERSGARTTPRALRIEVSESGRKVVNLRVPLALGRMALDHVPGLSTDNIARIREALEGGLTGPILVVEEDADGDGVRIVLE
jgi:hypothetical protein